MKQLFWLGLAKDNGGMSLTQITVFFIAAVLVVLVARYVGTSARHRLLLGGVGVVALVGGWYWLFPPDDSIRTFWRGEDRWFVTSVAFSPDGRSVLAGNSAGQLSLWDVATGGALRSIETGSPGAVNSVAFSPDGRTALSGGRFGGLALWDVATGTQVRTFQDTRFAEINSIAFSPDGRTVLSGSADRTLTLWEAASGQELRTVTTGAMIYSVAMSPDGLTALSGSWDGALTLWEVATGKELRTITTGSIVNSVAFSPDGRSAFSAGFDASSLILWELAAGKQIQVFRGHPGRVTSVAVSRDGRTVLSGGRASSPHHDLLQLLFPSLFGGDFDRTVRLWEVATGRQLRVFTGHSGRINSVALSPDGRTAASGGNEIKLWDLTGL